MIDRKKIWDHIFKKKNWGEYPSEELIRFEKKYLNQRNNFKKLLEIGCGTGGNLWYFARLGYIITGMNLICTHRLDAAKPKLSEELGCRVLYSCGRYSLCN